jgi:hypothetical protein
MNQPRRCAHCGLPLPPRRPGRGRTPVTHEGACRLEHRRALVRAWSQAHRHAPPKTPAERRARWRRIAEAAARGFADATGPLADPTP